MLLFTPGPTPVPETIRNAMGEQTIHHRTPEFEAIFENTRALLTELIGLKESLILASTGTGAMEACILNLCAKKALTINAGKFGERFGEICKAHGKDYLELVYSWDTPACREEIIEQLERDTDIDAVFLQICESAGGLRHPYEEIAESIKALNPNILVIVDAITAMGVEKIDTTNLDAIIGGSQKAFMLPPGLSFMGLSEKALARIEENATGFYFNLKTELKNQRKNTTAWTAATTLIIGLQAVLGKMHEMGFENLYKTTAARAKATRVALESIGLDIYPRTPANAMTAIIHPEADDIRKLLKNQFSVQVAGGQGHLKGQLFRINHMGFIEPHESAWVVNAIEFALWKLHDRAFDSTANTAFMETFFSELDNA